MEADNSADNTEPPANQATKIIIIVTCVFAFLITAVTVAGFVGCAQRKPKARHLLRLPQMRYQTKDVHTADVV